MPIRLDIPLLDGRSSSARPMNNKSVVEALGRALWELAKDHAIIFLDPIVGWAGAASDIFGFDEAEMVGKPLNRLFIKEDQEQSVPEHERALAVSAGRSEDDRWHVRKDGARIWVTGSLMALRDGTRLLGFCKIVTDRTNLRTTFETLQNRLEAAQHEVATEPYSSAASLTKSATACRPFRALPV